MDPQPHARRRQAGSSPSGVLTSSEEGWTVVVRSQTRAGWTERRARIQRGSTTGRLVLRRRTFHRGGLPQFMTAG